MSRHEASTARWRRLARSGAPDLLARSMTKERMPRAAVLTCIDVRLPGRLLGIPLEQWTVVQTLGAAATEGALAVLAGASDRGEPLEVALVLTHDGCCQKHSRIEQRAALHRTSSQLTTVFGDDLLVVRAHLNAGGGVELLADH